MLRDTKNDWYVSSIQNTSESDFSISVPTSGLDSLFLQSGDVVKINLATETSKIKFDTVVLGWNRDNIPLYVLAMPRDYKKIQRREFYRISAFLEVLYAEINESGEQSGFIPCSSLDISGGGIRLLLKKVYQPGAQLRLKIKIPLEPDVEVEVIGKVVRTWPHQDPKQQQTAVQFIKIRRRQQDLIVRFVLNKIIQQKRLV